jgi:hypothetical protein
VLISQKADALIAKEVQGHSQVSLTLSVYAHLLPGADRVTASARWGSSVFSSQVSSFRQDEVTAEIQYLPCWASSSRSMKGRRPSFMSSGPHSLAVRSQLRFAQTFPSCPSRQYAVHYVHGKRKDQREHRVGEKA